MKNNIVVVFCRSVLFNLGYVFITVVHCSIGMLVAPLMPFKYRFPYLTYWNKIIAFWGKITCGIDHKVIGEENIPDGACVIVSKHQSPWETFYFQVLFPPLSTVLKLELLFIPLFGWCLAMLRPIAINRSKKSKAVKQIIDIGKERLEQGIRVLIFPEGTRIPYGKAGNYNKGGAILAKAAGVPLLPVAHNAGKYWPAHSFLKYPGTIVVSIGKVIDSDDKDAIELMKEVKGWIEDEVKTIK